MKRKIKLLYCDLVIKIASREIILQKRLGDMTFENVQFDCKEKVKLV